MSLINRYARAVILVCGGFFTLVIAGALLAGGLILFELIGYSFLKKFNFFELWRMATLGFGLLGALGVFTLLVFFHLPYSWKMKVEVIADSIERWLERAQRSMERVERILWKNLVLLRAWIFLMGALCVFESILTLFEKRWALAVFEFAFAFVLLLIALKWKNIGRTIHRLFPGIFRANKTK